MTLRPRSRKPVPPALPTAAELDILSALWRLGPATVRQVHDAMDKARGYTTTLKQMQGMVEKEFVVRSERFGVHVYAPGIPRRQMQKRIAGDLIRRVFGSTANLVMGALQAKPASAEEMAEIRKLIDAHRGPRTKKQEGRKS